jgi:hypothetical protein
MRMALPRRLSKVIIFSREPGFSEFSAFIFLYIQAECWFLPFCRSGPSPGALWFWFALACRCKASILRGLREEIIALDGGGMVGCGRAWESQNLGKTWTHCCAPLDVWFVAKPLALAYTSEN